MAVNSVAVLASLVGPYLLGGLIQDLADVAIAETALATAPPTACFPCHGRNPCWTRGVGWQRATRTS